MAPKKELPSLIKALEFVALAQKDKGAPYQTHVMLGRNTAVAYDGVLSAGHLIEEDLTACPHTITLVAALKKCTGALSVTQLSNDKLSVKSGKFRSLVPCLPNATLPGIAPDPRVGYINNSLRDGLELLSPFIVENSQRVVTASAYIRPNSILATNGQVLLEYWHGIDMPPGLIVPKLFITALCKIDKNIVGFGYSESTFTVYFEDNSWLKTQLYNEKWPNCDDIMARPHSPVSLPPTFFDGLATVFNFVEDGRIRLRNGKIHSHADDNSGASYEVDGLTANAVFNAKHLKLLDGMIKTIDFTGNKGISYFYGDNIRGALTQVKE